jgi:hypothetical protein
MKKVLLLGTVVLMALSANAQLLRSVQTMEKAKHADLTNQVRRVEAPNALTPEEAKMTYREVARPGAPIVKKNSPKREDSSTLEPFYKRPAGAFSAYYFVDEEDNGMYIFYASYYAFKPYSEYTWHGDALGKGPNTNFHWDFFYWDGGRDDQGGLTYGLDMIDNMQDAPYTWAYENGEMPILYAENDPEGEWPSFQLGAREVSGDYANPVPGAFHASRYASASDYNYYFGGTMFWGSKNFDNGIKGDHYYNSMPSTGMDPYHPANEYGWWFGKNAGTVTNDETGVKRTLRIDGVAQIFEKPTHPYVLNRVMMVTYAYYLNVVAPVELECRIYRLDEVPAYDPEGPVALRDADFGELIATGNAIVTPATKTEDNGVFYFTLWGEEDGIPVEITPTIDFPIIVVFDGYNAPDKANLRDFTLEISEDDQVDEGFGELAYIKYGLNDDDGNFTGQYVWAGLNNFFYDPNGYNQNKVSMTGLSIFLDIANPFLTLYYSPYDDGIYTFPVEGGQLRKTITDDQGGSITTDNIRFYSWVASADDGWMLSTPEGEDVPEWLSIELTDGVETEGAYAGEFDNNVYAVVNAEPLPEGMKGRKAVVRFGFPGAFIDYTFIQGDPDPDWLQGDVNGDGEVNIADVNALINVIMGAEADSDTMVRADVNEDSEINIADINALIDIILGA